MFALSEVVGMGSRGGIGFERRALTFAKLRDAASLPKGGMDDVMEVRVSRSKGRKRVVPEPKVVPRGSVSDEQADSGKGGIFGGAKASMRKDGCGIE